MGVGDCLDLYGKHYWFHDIALGGRTAADSNYPFVCHEKCALAAASLRETFKSMTVGFYANSGRVFCYCHENAAVTMQPINNQFAVYTCYSEAPTLAPTDIPTATPTSSPTHGYDSFTIKSYVNDKDYLTAAKETNSDVTMQSVTVETIDNIADINGNTQIWELVNSIQENMKSLIRLKSKPELCLTVLNDDGNNCVNCELRLQTCDYSPQVEFADNKQIFEFVYFDVSHCNIRSVFNNQCIAIKNNQVYLRYCQPAAEITLERYINP